MNNTRKGCFFTDKNCKKYVILSFHTWDATQKSSPSSRLMLEMKKSQNSAIWLVIIRLPFTLTNNQQNNFSFNYKHKNFTQLQNRNAHSGLIWYMLWMTNRLTVRQPIIRGAVQLAFSTKTAIAMLLECPHRLHTSQLLLWNKP